MVDADIPFLLSLADMDQLSLVYDNLKSTLSHKPSAMSAAVQEDMDIHFFPGHIS